MKRERKTRPEEVFGRFAESRGLRGRTVIAALSGGADSVCLFLLAAEARESLGLRVVPVHVHHGIRGAEADRDEAFCRDLCARYGLECRVARADAPARAKEKGIGLEEAAREVRYEALREAAREEGAACILLAHHRDDQAETVLFRLMRGSSAAGLSGMAEYGDGLGRPLLSLSREEIREWLAARGQDWCEDSTNRDTEAARARIRHELLPLMEEIRPGTAARLADAAGELRAVSEYLRGEAARVLDEAGFHGADDTVPVSMSGLPEALRREALHLAAARALGSAKDVTRVHVEAMEGILSGPNGRETVLPGGLRAAKTAAGLVFRKPGSGEGQPVLPRAVMTVEERVPGEELSENPCRKCFSYDKINLMPALRFRQPGDRLTVYADGRGRKLQDYFTDAKIPEWERDRVPLLAAGREILWVIGYRKSAGFDVTEDTKLVLTVRLEDQAGAVEGGDDGGDHSCDDPGR